MKYNLREDGPGRSILEITQGDFSKVEDGESRYRHSLDGDDTVLQGIKKLAEAQVRAG
jgi:hypothetical protein